MNEKFRHLDGKFCHFEHASQDPEAAKTFYGQLFGWTMNDVDMGGETYTLFSSGGEVGGGIMKSPMAGAASAWSTYVDVGDLGAALTKVESEGGKIIVPATKVPNTGTFALIEDPTGALLGLWEQDPEGH